MELPRAHETPRYERFGLEEDTFIDYIERLKYIADASPLPKPPSS